MKRVPAEINLNAALVIIGILFALTLSACERPASRSTWSPIEAANQNATASVLPQTLAPAQTTEPATVQSTAAPIPTLDFSQLPDKFPASVKGYELYSWQVGEVWNFTLITGTDRSKSFEEIISPENTIDPNGFIKVTVTGTDALKELLKRLPSGAEVLWSGFDLGGEVPAGTVYLTLPPQAMIDEISLYCRGLGIKLTANRP